MKQIIPIIFSSDNNYVPYLYVALSSVVANSDSCNEYKAYVLHDSISEENKKHLLTLQKAYFSIEFVDVSHLEEKYGKCIFPLSGHFTIATYYRFFLPELFLQYDKVVYLDCDMLILKDIAQLYSIDIGDNILGATRDIGVICRHDIGEDYCGKVLKLKNIQNYLQAGCLVLNLKQMRIEHTTQQLLDKLIEIKRPMFVDQCILNAVCQGKVYFIPQNWNYTWHIPFVDVNYARTIPAPYNTAYEEAKNKPFIIHFTGCNMKPEDYPCQPESKQFLAYAFHGPYADWHKNKIEDTNLCAIKKMKRCKFKIIEYTTLSIITCGKMRMKYQEKRRDYKQRLSKIESFLRNNKC